MTALERAFEACYVICNEHEMEGVSTTSTLERDSAAGKVWALTVASSSVVVDLVAQFPRL